MILSVIHSAGRVGEGELRYQLAKRGHPLADDDGLLLELRDLERQGLLRSELVVSLTDAGRERLGA